MQRDDERDDEREMERDKEREMERDRERNMMNNMNDDNRELVARLRYFLRHSAHAPDDINISAGHRRPDILRELAKVAKRLSRQIPKDAKPCDFTRDAVYMTDEAIGCVIDNSLEEMTFHEAELVEVELLVEEQDDVDDQLVEEEEEIGDEDV